MTGLGSFSAGLFLFPEEKILGNSSFQQKEMHPLWTITIKRPGCMEIVQSIILHNFQGINDLFCCYVAVLAEYIER